MKITRVEIDRFRAICRADISFADSLGETRPVTVIAGPNGSGKTSILYAIIQTLRGVMGYYTDDVPSPVEADVFRSGNNQELLSEPPAARVKVTVSYPPPETAAILEVFEAAGDDRVQPSFFTSIAGNALEGTVTWAYPGARKPDGTRQPPNSATCSPRKLWNALQGRRTAINAWRNRKLPNRSGMDQIGGIAFFPQDRNLRDRVVGTGGGVGGRRTAVRPADGEADLATWGILEYLSSQAKDLEEAGRGDLVWERLIQERFRQVCAPKEYVGFRYRPDDPEGAPYFRDGGSVYPLQMAASGEQVLIEYVTRLVYPSPMNRSVILIDEPEVHLHPAWVRKLYYALPQMGEDNQFIVTTHSPELRSLAASDNALVDLGDLEGVQ